MQFLYIYTQQKHGNVNTTSNILSLNPFLDRNDILRVDGCLTNATIQCDRKHQISLQRKHALTELIINDVCTSEAVTFRLYSRHNSHYTNKVLANFG